jgi:hypothetical protein
MKGIDAANNPPSLQMIMGHLTNINNGLKVS